MSSSSVYSNGSPEPQKDLIYSADLNNYCPEHISDQFPFDYYPYSVTTNFGDQTPMKQLIYDNNYDAFVSTVPPTNIIHPRIPVQYSYTVASSLHKSKPVDYSYSKTDFQHQRSFVYNNSICSDDTNYSPQLPMKEKTGIICEWVLKSNPYNKEICGKLYHTVQDLVEHVTSDHFETDCHTQFCCLWYNCARNEKPFRARYKLVNHMRVHTGEKPFKCHYFNCGKFFARAENLKIHIRTHTGQKPFKCVHPGCDKSFSNSSDRRKHSFGHINQRPFACSENGCSKTFIHPSSLRKHIKIHHKLNKIHCFENSVDTSLVLNMSSEVLPSHFMDNFSTDSVWVSNQTINILDPAVPFSI